ncbi:MAG: guanylate kinase [Porticoccaceae bacterium]|jgi:guanylate kinase|nr:guanylate kinase [Porticoccaceae bacterium]MBT4211293.1 guanylate kinase [Porticoccaceae bacterium]MBT4591083.1 guanylate kinase [Porticoccaceae bacterium]MBT5102881.1 guanylate kinase [Porticoccaceae bacterium]MBT6422995.1 guanylate kinase [Porticoccaceae bacterium]|tara:strand:- start:187 stop:795 length:609 start_codon:yes stop_codon:yes gene_type:complete
MKQGTLFIVSAPSGAGKTSLVGEILTRGDNIQASVSHTTRERRSGEKDGVNYHFVNQSEFLKMVDDDAFLEHAEVFGNHYGTSESWVRMTLELGIDVILEIDWQGAEQARKHFPSSQSIFILPPSKQALQERLTLRGQDNREVIDRRIAAATQEMSHYIDADYLIINDDFETARAQLESIITAQRCQLPATDHQDLLNDLLT